MKSKHIILLLQVQNINIMEILIAYLLLFFASLASGASVLALKNHESKSLKLISVFGGAFLLAVCFIDLIPAMFEHESHSHDHHLSHSFLPLGATILIGFLLQLFLEQLSKGAEHGHIHSNSNQKSKISAIMLLIGVSIHGFLEGFPIVNQGEINAPMITGIIIHNIPLSIIIVTVLIQSGYNKIKSMLLLSIFSSMAIIGSVLNQNLSILEPFQNIILGIVVGILLHVSTTTLFDTAESHKYNQKRFLIVVLAFLIVILLPSHIH